MDYHEIVKEFETLLFVVKQIKHDVNLLGVLNRFS